MKKLFGLSTTICILLFACGSKNDIEPRPSNDDYYIYAKANGQSISYIGDLFQQSSGGVQGSRNTMTASGAAIKHVVVNGYAGPNNRINFTIVADSVRPGQTYNLMAVDTTGSATVTINGKQYQTFSSATPQYFASVLIKEHSAGWISGTFTGKLGSLKPGGDYDELDVTEGSFKTKLIY